jgi:hypothetical protein
MSVVVFPIPLGAKKTPFAPGVCGKGSGGFFDSSEFQLVSLAFLYRRRAISVKARNGHNLLCLHGHRNSGANVLHKALACQIKARKGADYTTFRRMPFDVLQRRSRIERAVLSTKGLEGVLSWVSSFC